MAILRVGVSLMAVLRMGVSLMAVLRVGVSLMAVLMGLSLMAVLRVGMSLMAVLRVGVSLTPVLRPSLVTLLAADEKKHHMLGENCIKSTTSRHLALHVCWLTCNLLHVHAYTQNLIPRPLHPEDRVGGGWVYSTATYTLRRFSSIDLPATCTLVRFSTMATRLN